MWLGVALILGIGVLAVTVGAIVGAIGRYRDERAAREQLRRRYGL